MLILGFDTSNAYSSVSISNGSDILYAKRETVPNTQAERLIFMIEEALEKTNLTYKDLKYLAVSSGPGSFTGIRIALATAKGLLLAAPHIKPVAVNNFQMVNFRIRQQCMVFDYAIASVNAFRDQLYLQIFTKKGEYQEPVLVTLDEAKEIVSNLKGLKALGGSGLHLLYNTCSDIPDNTVILPRFAYPDARFVCRVAHQHIAKHKENPNIEPLYIRPPDAKLPQ